MHDYEPSVEAFRDDVLSGFSRRPKRLPSKYFYDQRGCELFEQICRLDEYYPTRTELEIMQRYSGEMADRLGDRCMLVEYGSGASTKTRILLDHLDDVAAYVPVDIARDHLQQTATVLYEDYDDLNVLPVCADFTQPFSLPTCDRKVAKTVVYFPGSTIGNLEEAAAQNLLQQVADLCGEDGGLLLGIDLQKDANVLHAAYNDAGGVTADFNLNMLERINRELDADFDLDLFEHRARYNADDGRIEMHLVSRADQEITIGDESFPIDNGETICTEYSHKYDLENFCNFAAEAGLTAQQHWSDPQRYFAVVYLEA